MTVCPSTLTNGPGRDLQRRAGRTAACVPCRLCLGAFPTAEFPQLIPTGQSVQLIRVRREPNQPSRHQPRGGGVFCGFPTAAGFPNFLQEFSSKGKGCATLVAQTGTGAVRPDVAQAPPLAARLCLSPSTPTGAARILKGTHHVRLADPS